MKEDIFQRALRFLYERCLEKEGLRANVIVTRDDAKSEKGDQDG